MMARPRNGYWYAAAAVVIWTGFILVSRWGGLSALLANDIIAIRYATCALVLLPVWLIPKYRFNLFKPRLIVAGVVGGLGYALCAFRGFTLAPASHAAVLLPGSLPLLTILLARLLGGERQHLLTWCAVALISCGIGVLAWSSLSSGAALTYGHGWFVVAAACWALFTVLVKRWSITPWQAMVSLAFITSLFYLPLYWFLLAKNIEAAGWREIALQAIYQGVLATIVQMYCYVTAVRKIGPTKMGSLMALVPVLAALLALWVFAEPVTVALLIALVCVSFGAWLAHAQPFLKKRRKACLTST